MATFPATIKLSIVMPVYNESRTIHSVIEQALAVDYPCQVEIIVVDDGSDDQTAAQLAKFVNKGPTLIRHSHNVGKGAAVRTGVAYATGTHLIILDADLEYSPADIPVMLEPVLTGRAGHVFGSRIFGLNTRFQSFRYAMGGRLLTLVANFLFDSCLTDMHTCLKLVPVEDFRRLILTEDGFGLDTELTARLLRSGVRPFEVPISYAGRSVQEGKKITWRDGIRCLAILVRIRAQRPPRSALMPLSVTVAGPTSAVVAGPFPNSVPPPRRRAGEGSIEDENSTVAM